MDLDRLISDSRKVYRSSGKKLAVPHPPYVPSGPEWARASGLGLCELQLGYEKYGVEPDFPELTAHEDDEKAWIMDHGSYVAPMIQEPLMYAAMTRGFIFEPEVPLRDEALRVAGVADGILEVGGEKVVLEIKDTEGVQKRSVGQPKRSYALQTLCYMLLTGIRSAFIITVSKWGWNTYRLLETGETPGRFMIYDRDFNRWQPPVWVENFNSPDILNFDAVKREIEKYHAAARQVVTYERSIGLQSQFQLQTPVPPITDPLNDDRSFLCMWHSVKPTKTKNGIASPNCAFAKRCHGLQNRDYETVKREGVGYELVQAF